MKESQYKRRRLIGNMLMVVFYLAFLPAGCSTSKPADIPPITVGGDATPVDTPTITIGEETTGYMKITAQEAKEIIDREEPYLLLDVRTEQEHSEIRIDGSILIPVADITERALGIIPDKNMVILVYCRSGARSATASETLAKMGYTRVYDIGGIIDWPYETVSGMATLGGQISASLLYQGHSSLRITTAEGKVIYVDPYAGAGYDLPADLILVTHQHSDHNKISLVVSKNPGCEVITEKEALKDGNHQAFDFGYATVEAVEAGNKNHDPSQCVGYIITLSGGIQLYISGDTSKTAQMATFAERSLDYAFLCCDGVYNMDIAEASECATLVGARHSIPYHISPGNLFDRNRAEQFEVDGCLIVADGDEIALVKE